MAKTEKAIFAAGCFWGVQDYFDQIPGVIETLVGYTGGNTENPTYHEVTTERTGHAEAIEVTFDPKKVSYRALVKHFFRLQNPTDYYTPDGVNTGANYRSALFYFDDEQKRIAEEVRDEVQRDYTDEITTEFSPATTFYPAEGYHQKYTQQTGQGSCHIAYEPLPEEKSKI